VVSASCLSNVAASGSGASDFVSEDEHAEVRTRAVIMAVNKDRSTASRGRVCMVAS